MHASVKIVGALVASMAASSVPAFACMGPTVLYTDTFQQANPSWVPAPQGATLTISGGSAQLTPAQGGVAIGVYLGANFDTADACIDALSPAVTPANAGVAGSYSASPRQTRCWISTH